MIVFFLGAGFSKCAGYPTMSGFIPHCRELLRAASPRLSDSEKECLNAFIAFQTFCSRATVHCDFPLENLEALYAFADMLRIAEPDLHVTCGAQSVRIKDVCRLMLKAVQLVYLRKQGAADEIPGEQQMFLYKMKKRLEKHEVVFITTNYDVSLERALMSQGTSGCNYGIPMELLQGGKRKEFVSNSPEAVKILKLHGSANWWRQPGKQEVLVAGSTLLRKRFDPGAEEMFEFVRDLEFDFSNFRAPDGLDPYLLAPAYSKILDEPAIAHIWGAAIEAIKSAEQIVFIGYSFPTTDMSVMQLLTAGLYGKMNLDGIVFANPDGEALSRLKKKYFSRTVESKLVEEHDLLSFIESKGFQDMVK